MEWWCPHCGGQEAELNTGSMTENMHPTTKFSVSEVCHQQLAFDLGQLRR